MLTESDHNHVAIISLSESDMKYQKTENLIDTSIQQHFIIGKVSNDKHVALICNMGVIGIL